ncbi:hypothetical protein GW17_00032478 [Ensete ventricosum]|nr:hypothetical protein GW17_00032478 [Ensete ventricosum]RZS24718.1 hypothetical protein BHM03_00057820 [Ensete ventricosum]
MRSEGKAPYLLGSEAVGIVGQGDGEGRPRRRTVIGDNAGDVDAYGSLVSSSFVLALFAVSVFAMLFEFVCMVVCVARVKITWDSKSSKLIPGMENANRPPNP